MAPGRRISTLLVANRGEIARRVIAAAQSMGMSTVAVYSDADSGAPYVAEADRAVRLPGRRASDTYLRSELIVEAALRAGADAVHPGYGFLSESSRLPEACDDAGLVFVGPPASVVHAMASKIEAKELAASVGVPVLPMLRVGATRRPLHASRPDGDGGAYDGEADAADVDPAETGVPDLDALSARGLRFPLLVKASAGGGGTGIRLAATPEDLAGAISTARREAEAAFGDGTLFLEPFLEAPRHVEVQVLADRHGTVLHLFDRECSVQRRHQKVVEEAPSPSIDAALREGMCAAALDLAEAVGYVGAGTVEFLVDDDRFYFLEMNTRLQVEHRVTELVTGTDLVRAQLVVASDLPLPWSQAQLRLRGSAIEARLYAEDPASGYLPTTGTVEHYSHRSFEGVLYDDAVESGSVVSAHYDGLLAKVVAHGADRTEARGRLARAVRGLRLDGVRTNRHLLVAVLEDADFAAGRVDTGYLDRRPDLAASGLARDVQDAHAVAAAGLRVLSGHARSPLAHVPASWRNVGTPSCTLALRSEAGDLEVAIHGPPDAARMAVGDRTYEGSVQVVGHDAGDGARGATQAAPGERAVDVTLDGFRTRCAVRVRGERVWVNSAAGQSDFSYGGDAGALSETSAHGSVTTPVPGTVTAVLVEPGVAVRAGDVLVVVEAMKMEHRVRSTTSGSVVTVGVVPGDVVDAHQVLAVVEPAAADKSLRHRSEGPAASPPR